MHGCINGQMDAHMIHKWICGCVWMCVDGWVDGWAEKCVEVYGWMDGWADVWIDRQMCECVDMCTHGYKHDGQAQSLHLTDHVQNNFHYSTS